MVAVRKDLIVEQGRTFSFIIEVLNPDKTPKNLTGWTARAQIRPDVNSSTKYVEFDVTSGWTTAINAASGLVTLSGTKAATTILTWLTGVYDVEIENISTTECIAPVKGNVVVHREVTR